MNSFALIQRIEVDIECFQVPINVTSMYRYAGAQVTVTKHLCIGSLTNANQIVNDCTDNNAHNLALSCATDIEEK